MCNDVDPLGYVASSDDDDSIDDDYPLSRLLADDVSDDSDDVPLAQSAKYNKSDIMVSLH
jgi:hypothetical protein